MRLLEAELPGARAAFSTRIGGVSSGPYESLNLGLQVGDRPGAVRENRRRLAEAIGRGPSGFLIGRQVHGAEIRDRGEAPGPNPYLDPRADPPAAADGQRTAAADLTALVQVADCLPIALAGTGGVAMLHCGWRGLAAGIIADGAAAFEPRAAAIGPGIGSCCYQVGDEVLAEFAGLGPGLAVDGRLDLVEVARRLLGRAGVSEVEVAGVCTSCEPELFFSYRRDVLAFASGAVPGSGERFTGRQAGVVWREGSGGG